MEGLEWVEAKKKKRKKITWGEEKEESIYIGRLNFSNWMMYEKHRETRSSSI